VLGLISTKVAEPESKEVLKRASTRPPVSSTLTAGRFVPRAVSRHFIGYDRMDLDVQEPKLELLVATTGEIGG